VSAVVTSSVAPSPLMTWKLDGELRTRLPLAHRALCFGEGVRSSGIWIVPAGTVPLGHALIVVPTTFGGLCVMEPLTWI
jgi:hypothetical protein